MKLFWSQFGILRNHLENVIRQLPNNQRTLALKVLGALVSSKGERILRSKEEISQELKMQGVVIRSVDDVLNRLVGNHLLRVEEREGATEDQIRAFELSHEYLLDTVKLDPDSVRRKVAQELVDMKLPYYRRDGILLSKDKLTIILPQRQMLSLSEDADVMLSASRKSANRG